MFDTIKRMMLLLCLLLLPLGAVANASKTLPEARTDISDELVLPLSREARRRQTMMCTPAWQAAVGKNPAVAVDITLSSHIRVNRNGNDRERLTDDRYKTYWNGGNQGWIEFTLPPEMPCYGIYIKWAEKLSSYVIETLSGDVWQPVTLPFDSQYYNEYIPLEGYSHFRIRNVSNVHDFCVTEIQLLSAGSVPEWVEQWKPFKGEADLLVLSAHPDDEILWFGGMIPYYRGERQKKVLVVNLSEQPASRKCELLDCLWTCGVREYPIVTGGDAFVDRYASQTRAILDMWGETRVLQFVTSVIRQYRPLVAVTHGFNGEYGHGAHRTCAYALTNCLQLAADPDYVLYGDGKLLSPWQIRKVYIHLYEENPIEMDWRKPLSAFNGRTAYQVACDAFERHRTQHTGKYEVRDFGKYDNRKFGLYFSAVGPDEQKNDFFEHITEERGIRQTQ